MHSTMLLLHDVHQDRNLCRQFAIWGWCKSSGSIYRLPACHACAPSLPACRLPSILPSPMYSVLCIDLISILHYFVIVSMCAVIFMEFFEQLQIEGFLRLDDIQKQFCYPQTILERRRAFYPQVILHSLIIHKSSFNNVAQIK
jgi:hypothetical protein